MQINKMFKKSIYNSNVIVFLIPFRKPLAPNSAKNMRGNMRQYLNCSFIYMMLLSIIDITFYRACRINEVTKYTIYVLEKRTKKYF